MRVEWAERCANRLADIYVGLDLTGQRAIAQAIERINATLARDPWELGESRANRTRRAWNSGPVSVVFDIVNDDLVVVQHVAIKRPN
jgi:hypothetical protein